MKTLVILHGWQGCKERWQPVKEKIEKNGVRVIVPDLPGFKKENALKEIWNLDSYVSWVKKLTEENIEGKFFLMGHSFGGRVAIKFSVRHPELLAGLILCDAAGVTPRSKIKIKFFAGSAKMGSLIFSLPGLRIFRSWAKKIAHFLVGANDYHFVQNPLMKEAFKKVINEDLTLLLPKIQNPTLIIWGEKDKTTPLDDAYLMKKEIKNSRLEILNNLSHTPYQEDPTKISELVTNFVQSE